MVEAFNEAALEHGNYDWGIAIHPYPEPLTRVNYWSAENDKTPEAEILTVMNLNVLTDIWIQKEKSGASLLQNLDFLPNRGKSCRQRPLLIVTIL